MTLFSCLSPLTWNAITSALDQTSFFNFAEACTTTATFSRELSLQRWMHVVFLPASTTTTTTNDDHNDPLLQLIHITQSRTDQRNSLFMHGPATFHKVILAPNIHTSATLQRLVCIVPTTILVEILSRAATHVILPLRDVKVWPRDLDWNALIRRRFFLPFSDESVSTSITFFNLLGNYSNSWRCSVARAGKRHFDAVRISSNSSISPCMLTTCDFFEEHMTPISLLRVFQSSHITIRGVTEESILSGHHKLICASFPLSGDLQATMIGLCEQQQQQPSNTHNLPSINHLVNTYATRLCPVNLIHDFETKERVCVGDFLFMLSVNHQIVKYSTSDAWDDYCERIQQSQLDETFELFSLFQLVEASLDPMRKRVLTAPCAFVDASMAQFTLFWDKFRQLDIM